MTRALITGIRGFMGKNLSVALKRLPGVRVEGFDLGDDAGRLEGCIREGVDVIYHLAGANRPREESEFFEVNVGLTERIVDLAGSAASPPVMVFSSSIQAELDNPYGRSKRDAEEALSRYARRSGRPVLIYRLPNVFGKWSRPDYNSVVATFCANIAGGREARIDDPHRKLTFVYIDDVVREFARLCREPLVPASSQTGRGEVTPQYQMTVGGLAETIRRFHESRQGSLIPSLEDPLSRYLYATYLSFLGEGDLARVLQVKRDARGWLAEVIKSAGFGQIFVSQTRPGITRGNHYHDTKVEKFLVVQGEALIRLQCVADGRAVEYRVSGAEPALVDIPPGFAHSLTNIGAGDLLTIFWADEIFDPVLSDTYPQEVAR